MVYVVLGKGNDIIELVVKGSCQCGQHTNDFRQWKVRMIWNLMDLPLKIFFAANVVYVGAMFVYNAFTAISAVIPVGRSGVELNRHIRIGVCV